MFLKHIHKRNDPIYNVICRYYPKSFVNLGPKHILLMDSSVIYIMREHYYSIPRGKTLAHSQKGLALSPWLCFYIL